MSTTQHPAVQVTGLVKEFGEGATRVRALAGIDLTVDVGEFAAIMGPSGSGKSTLLHLIGGLDVGTDGHVAIAGERLSDLDDDALTALRRRRIGFVFQAFNLVTVLTAEENVALPLVVEGLAEKAAHERAAAALDRVGLAPRGYHLPGELSGGEQQRVALARALVTEPDLVLADEPTGNLDRATGDQVMRLLREMNEEGLTVVMVTHDAGAAAISDRIVRLEDGRVVDDRALPEGRDARDVLRSLGES